MGTQTFTYTFQDGTYIDTINANVSTPATNSTGYGLGYSINSISGSFEGTSITGESGVGGAEQTNSNGQLFDNTIFTSNTSGSTQYGASGSNYGIDVEGFEFTTATATYNIFHDQDFYLVNLTTNHTSTITLINSDAPCYCTGTLIRTARGDVSVEHLVVGDLVVTASGAQVPIKWLGSRVTDCTAHADPRQVRPIRIAAHAFGPGRPARDLRVSPDHAICVDLLGEVLVPAFAFLNGATVTQDRDDEVTYWHVELEGGHGILMAENLPAESYLDCGNRGFFAGETVAIDPSLDAVGSCRERTTDPVLLTALRARLRRHAEALGWRLDAAEFGGVRLIVDGATILPDSDGLAARFLLPSDARDVWLVSAASVPWDVSDAADGRRLGLCLGALAVGDGLSVQRAIALDDPRLGDGFYPPEDAGYRWTDGRARLDPELWAGCRGHVFLRLALAQPCLPAWRAPAASATSLRVA